MMAKLTILLIFIPVLCLMQGCSTFPEVEPLEPSLFEDPSQDFIRITSYEVPGSFLSTFRFATDYGTLDEKYKNKITGVAIFLNGVQKYSLPFNYSSFTLQLTPNRNYTLTMSFNTTTGYSMVYETLNFDTF